MASMMPTATSESPGAVALPEVRSLESEAGAWPARARDLEVVDAESYEFAAAFVLEIAARRKRIQAGFADPIAKAHAAHKALTEWRARVDAPYAEADRLASPKLAHYLAEEERKRREAERRAQEAQRNADAAARAAEVAVLEAAGEREQAQAVREAPPPPPVVIPPSVPKAGLAGRTTWKGRVTDLRALARAVADGQVPEGVFQVVQSVLDAAARSHRSALKWPGVVAYEETGLVRRG